MTTITVTPAEQSVADSIATPEGFTKTVEGNHSEWGKPGEEAGLIVKLENETIRLTITITTPSPDDWCGRNYSTQWSCIDSFLVSGNRRVTFFRCGVDCDTFGGGVPREGAELDSYELKCTDVNAQVDALITRIREHQAKTKDYVTLPAPFSSFRASAEQIEGYKKLLRTGQYVTFTPSGFGTGYRLMTRRSSRYDKPVSAEVARFFGVNTLYYETLDCD